MSVSLNTYRNSRYSDLKADDFKNLFANKQFFEFFKIHFEGVFQRGAYNTDTWTNYDEIEDIQQLSFVTARTHEIGDWIKRRENWTASYYWWRDRVIPSQKVPREMYITEGFIEYFPIPLFDNYINKALKDWFNSNKEPEMATSSRPSPIPAGMPPPVFASDVPQMPPGYPPAVPPAPPNWGGYPQVPPKPAPWDKAGTPAPPPTPAPWDDLDGMRNQYRAYQPEEEHFPTLNKGTKTMKDSIKESASTTATTVANVALGQLGLQALKSAMFTLLPRRFGFWARLTGQHKKVIENPLVIAAAAFGINQVAQHYLKDGTTGAKQVKRLAQSMQDVAALDVLNKYANVPENVKTMLESGTIPALTAAAPIEKADKE